MKLTLIRTARETGKETFSTWPSDTLMEKMKTENKAGHISALRSLIPHITGSNGHYPCIDKLPRICPAAEYARSKEGERYLKTYNGLVQIEVNHLANAVEVEQVKRQAALLPQTFAAFCGSSGRSVKIWVLFATPDGSRPRQEEKIRLFHTAAYRLAVNCYQPLLPYPITLKESAVEQSCRMTLDDRPYYNPSAVPFCLEQPLSVPDEPTFGQRKQTEANPLMRIAPVEADEGVMKKLETSADILKIGTQRMPSGAGHDAMNFAAAGVPFAMLFVANRFGSHNPNEYMAMDDFLNAAGILARTVMDFDR